MIIPGEKYIVKKVPSDEVRIGYNYEMEQMLFLDSPLIIRVVRVESADGSALDEDYNWWCIENLIPLTPGIKLTIN